MLSAEEWFDMGEKKTSIILCVVLGCLTEVLVIQTMSLGSEPSQETGRVSLMADTIFLHLFSTLTYLSLSFNFLAVNSSNWNSEKRCWQHDELPAVLKWVLEKIFSCVIYWNSRTHPCSSQVFHPLSFSLLLSLSSLPPFLSFSCFSLLFPSLSPSLPSSLLSSLPLSSLSLFPPLFSPPLPGMIKPCLVSSMGAKRGGLALSWNIEKQALITIITPVLSNLVWTCDPPSPRMCSNSSLILRTKLQLDVCSFLDVSFTLLFFFNGR